MLTRTGHAAAKRKKPQRPKRPTNKGGVGALPEWDLSDLYPGLDSPEITGDLTRSDAQCLAFEEQYKGKLAALAAGPDGGKVLAAAVKELELIDDLIGRIASFAHLVYAGNSTDRSEEHTSELQSL
jgi:oligoendopeptidase F